MDLFTRIARSAHPNAQPPVSYVVSPYEAVVERFIRGQHPSPPEAQCAFGAKNTEIVGPAVKPRDMAAAATAAQCCEQCFGEESCNYFSFTEVGGRGVCMSVGV